MKTLFFAAVAFIASSAAPLFAQPEIRKERLKDYHVKVVYNQEDGLIVRKIVIRYAMVTDPATGGVHRKAVEEVPGEARYFIPHTEATKKIPNASVFKMKGTKGSARRVSGCGVIEVINFRLFESRPSIPEEER